MASRLNQAAYLTRLRTLNDRVLTEDDLVKDTPQADSAAAPESSSPEVADQPGRRTLTVRRKTDGEAGAEDDGRRFGLRSRFKPGGLKPVRNDPAPSGRPTERGDFPERQRSSRTDPAPRDETKREPRERSRDAFDRRDGRQGRDDRASRDARPPQPRGQGRSMMGSAAEAPDPRGVRLSKLMAERGLCSRREADWIIERGWVFVDGARVSELGVRFLPNVSIELAPEASRRQSERVTILLHKPVGYVSGQAEDGHEPAVVLIGPDNQFDRGAAQAFQRHHLRGLAPAGRLDIDSTGLLVLTQDGRVARSLIGDDSQVEKEYLVRVEGELDDKGLSLLNHGLELDGRQLRPARVERLNEDQLRFVLREGRKRQIRRMCELVGLHVVGLKRVRIGKVRLGDLPLGQWRFLRPDESF